MAMLDDILEHLQRTEREQKIRDAGILRSFEIFGGSMRKIAEMVNWVHEQGEEMKAAAAAIQTAVDNVRELILVLPPGIGDAINNALDERGMEIFEPADNVDFETPPDQQHTHSGG